MPKKIALDLIMEVVMLIHAVWFIRDGSIRDAFQRLLDLLEILRDEV